MNLSNYNCKKKIIWNTLELKDYDKHMAVKIGDSKEEMQLYINVNIIFAIGN